MEPADFRFSSLSFRSANPTHAKHSTRGGLIVFAQDKEAAKPIVDFATAARIPVFTADADIDSPNVKMYVGFSGERAGAELAGHLVDYLKSTHNGQVRGTVLEMLGSLGGASSIDRSKGFHDVIDQYKDVRVIQAVGDFQEAPAKTAAENVLRAHPRIDACYSANGPMATGAVEAMKDLNIDATKVYTVTIDATPGVLALIKSGDIRMALDQAPAFYTAIAAHYLVAYLKNGDAALPKVGDTINAQDLKLSTGVKHAGTDVWADNSAWAPAKVVKGLAGHLWFQTGAVLVTKDNADAPYLWANVKLPAKDLRLEKGAFLAVAPGSVAPGSGRSGAERRIDARGGLSLPPMNGGFYVHLSMDAGACHCGKRNARGGDQLIRFEPDPAHGVRVLFCGTGRDQGECRRRNP